MARTKSDLPGSYLNLDFTSPFLGQFSNFPLSISPQYLPSSADQDGPSGEQIFPSWWFNAKLTRNSPTVTQKVKIVSFRVLRSPDEKRHHAGLNGSAMPEGMETRLPWLERRCLSEASPLPDIKGRQGIHGSFARDHLCECCDKLWMRMAALAGDAHIFFQGPVLGMETGFQQRL